MNKDIFFYNQHKLKFMYMCLRQVSGRGHRTQDPYGLAFNALLLSYLQARCESTLNCRQRHIAEWPIILKLHSNKYKILLFESMENTASCIFLGRIQISTFSIILSVILRNYITRFSFMPATLIKDIKQRNVYNKRSKKKPIVALPSQRSTTTNTSDLDS